MARVLVTGGAGFIGSHVADAYVQRGDRVTVLDSLVHGRRENVPDGAEFVHLDIRDPAARELVRNGGFDIINNHAAQMDVRVSVNDPCFDADVNIVGLLNLLAPAIEAGVRRFIHVSSGGVIYGETDQRPTPEDAEKKPESPYGVSKLTGEQYLLYAHKVHGLQYAALRYSNVYGPRQDPHGEAGVVAIFATRLLRGEALTIFGDGEQTRDYVYVGDVVAANMLVSDVELPPGRTLDDRGFNVGTGVETSVNALARMMTAAAGGNGSATHAAARLGELQHSALDASRISALGWSPRMPLDDGLRRTYEWIAADHAAAPAS